MEWASGIDFGNSVINAAVKSVASPLRKRIKKGILAKGNFDDFVLIIDDLERIVEPLKTKEVFGYIATLQEQWKCKIVIISNQEKSYDAKDIVPIKEKVINKSLEFSEDVVAIADSIIKSSIYEVVLNPEIRDWDIRMAGNILSALTSEEINLRTVKSVMSTHAEFLVYLNRQVGLKKNEIEQMEKVGFLSIFVLTDCVKRGYTESSPGIEGIFDTTYVGLKMTQSFRSLTNEEKNSSQEKTEAETNEKGQKEPISDYILRVFHDKMSEFDSTIVYTRQVMNLVLHDSFDFQDFYSEIQEILFPMTSEIGLYIDKLEDFRRLSDEELFGVESYIQENMNLESDNFKYLFRTFSAILYLQGNDLLLVSWNIEEMYLKLLNRIQKMNEEEFRDNEWTFMHGNSGSADERENKLLEAYRIRGEKLSQDKDYEMAKSILKEDWRLKFRNGSFFEKSSLFKILLEENVIDKILVKKDYWSGVHGLMTYINTVITKDSNARNIHAHELKYAKAFLEELKSKELLVSDKVHLFNYRELESEIRQAITRLS